MIIGASLKVSDCASADHEAATKALIKGLTAGDRADGPKYLIHTSGTGILMHKDLESNFNKKPRTLGEAADDIYDDWSGVTQVTSLPDFAPHRKVDRLVIESDGPSLKTAIVCPPTIYGVARGPGNVRGHQLYELARCTLEKGHGLQIGAGKTFWTYIHVKDMSKVYLKLVNAALAGGGEATWGAAGYYFTENGEHVWGDVSKAVAREAKKQGLISDDQVLSVSADEGDRLTKYGSLLWGANSRCRAVRARELLGWVPIEKSLYEEIPNAVSSEARRLGLTSGHGSKVAG
ncbi:uncharacterized protein KY384_000464 [Bacidia gigantensis]|uniref:uncharacterized protein n=1 Tax=Bacidia gigantensis TaxID=2732470 RepID=UPI001D03AAC1|nr:uncharacterized protein KY384_000464 [Bacidia gigantensis]KAG8525704.1 hypothetical protein KY384_000464 [Bacidia gigantensis]